jgi:hypothetical protein
MTAMYDVVGESGGPEGPGDVLDHIVDVLELLSDVIGELDLELLLDEHGEFGVVELIES